MTDVVVVVGAQYGSEGKGAICAHIAESEAWGEHDLAIRVAGPNAGHTAWTPDGRREWKLRAVPVAAVVSSSVKLHVAAGSEVDLNILVDEVTRLEEAGIPVRERLTVHPAATILEPRHLHAEAADGLIGRIGSTGKGIGAARADRIMRRATTFGEYAQEGGFGAEVVGEPGPLRFSQYDRVMVEGTQGYGLGLHTANYPQVTSSDCRAVDFLAMAGIPPWDADIRRLHILLVARVYPIRVAGNSGPMRDETTWAELGLPEERTTVTQNIRRVGHWDERLVKEAILANGGPFNPTVTMALTMVDHKFPRLAGQVGGPLDPEAAQFVADLGVRLGIDIEMIGTGPKTVMNR